MDDQQLRARLHLLREPAVDESAATRALEESLAALDNNRGSAVAYLLHRTNDATFAQRKWQDWLWPSPLAWGALALVWAMVIASETAYAPAGKPSPHGVPNARSQESTTSQPRSLFATHKYNSLLREYQKISRVQ